MFQLNSPVFRVCVTFLCTCCSVLCDLNSVLTTVLFLGWVRYHAPVWVWRLCTTCRSFSSSTQQTRCWKWLLQNATILFHNNCTCTSYNVISVCYEHLHAFAYVCKKMYMPKTALSFCLTYYLPTDTVPYWWLGWLPLRCQEALKRQQQRFILPLWFPWE